MTITSAPAAQFHYLGTSDDVTQCEHCGRVDLSHTVAVAPIDVAGNTAEPIYLGSTCAARYLSRRFGVAVTAADVSRGIAAAKRAAEITRQQAEAARHAEIMAARDAELRRRGIDPRKASVRDCLAALAATR